MGNSSTNRKERVFESVPEITVGIDLGDRHSYYSMIDERGEVVEQGRIATTAAALQKNFAGRGQMRIAIETGTHCLWVSRLLQEMGHEVIVADARRLALISRSQKKSDERDSELLARLARVDPTLLHPVTLRSEENQKDLQLLKSREGLVRARTQLVCTVRGIFKARGIQLKSCSTPAFSQRVREQISKSERAEVESLLEIIQQLSKQIRGYDRKIERLCKARYPETELLRQISGVGPVTSLAFVLILKSPHLFTKNRDAGPYLGLCPRRDQSGDNDPELRISKAGDRFLRCLLVNCAQYIMRGPDCDLREFGERIAAKGKKKARKRAVVAVARKLAVLLLRLWRTGEVYDPYYNRDRFQQQGA